MNTLSLRLPLGLLIAILIATLGAGCSRRSAVEPAQPAQSIRGLADYNEAKGHIVATNYPAAIRALETAIQENPEFAEAWYQLGASKMHMAIREVRYDERRAVRLFREAVEAKRNAQHLMSLGKYVVWNDAQRRQASNDVQSALEDADAVMADEPSLIIALHAWDS